MRTSSGGTITRLLKNAFKGRKVKREKGAKSKKIDAMLTKGKKSIKEGGALTGSNPLLTKNWKDQLNQVSEGRRIPLNTHKAGEKFFRPEIGVQSNAKRGEGDMERRTPTRV